MPWARWPLDLARRVWTAAEPHARRAGFRLGIYGSTLSDFDGGSDLDLLAVAARPGADVDALVDAVVAACTAVTGSRALEHGRREGEYGKLSVVVACGGDEARFVDLCVYVRSGA